MSTPTHPLPHLCQRCLTPTFLSLHQSSGSSLRLSQEAGEKAIARIERTNTSPDAAQDPQRRQGPAEEEEEGGRGRSMSSAERRARSEGDRHFVGDARLEGTSNLWRVTIGAASKVLPARPSPHHTPPYRRA